MKAVATAWPMNRMAGVRIVDTGGTTVDCVVEATGRGTPTLTAVNAASPGAAQRRQSALLPGARTAADRRCGRLERALNSRGALVGYLHYDPC